MKKLDTVPIAELEKSAQTIKAEAIAQMPYETDRLERSIYAMVSKDKRRPGLLPLVEAGVADTQTLIASCASGVSGAGRGAKVGSLFCEAGENMMAYAVNGHRHLPEIKQGLSRAAGTAVGLTFVPHLVPMIRGIHATLYATVVDFGNNNFLRYFWCCGHSGNYKDIHFAKVVARQRGGQSLRAGRSFAQYFVGICCRQFLRLLDRIDICDFDVCRIYFLFRA